MISTVSILDLVPGGTETLTVTSDSVWVQTYFSVLPPFPGAIQKFYFHSGDNSKKMPYEEECYLRPLQRRRLSLPALTRCQQV